MKNEEAEKEVEERFDELRKVVSKGWEKATWEHMSHIEKMWAIFGSAVSFVIASATLTCLALLSAGATVLSMTFFIWCAKWLMAIAFSG